MKLIHSKKGQMGFALLTMVVLSLLVVVITEAVGGDILTSIRASQTAYGAAYNITTTGLTAFNTLANWNTTIVAVVAAVVILTFVMMLRGRSPEAQ